MKIKHLSFILISFVISSCKTSNDVVSSNKLSKRKYLKGYHFNGEVLSLANKDQAAESDNETFFRRENLEFKELKSLNFVASNNTEVHLINSKGLKVYDSPQETSKTQEPQVFNESIKQKHLKSLKKDLKKSLKSPVEKGSENDAGKGDTAALLSLIFGTLGFATMWFTGIGLLFLLTGFILGFVGLKSEDKKSLAVIGLIFSGLGILIFIALVAILAALII